MKKFLFYFIQLTILLTIVFLIVLSNQKIDFFWKGIVFTGNTSTLLIGLVILIFIALIFQRIYLYIKQSPKRIKDSLKIKNYNKSFNAIVKAMAALYNNDDKELNFQSNILEKLLKNNPISIILRAEAAKKSKKFDIAENHYNTMLLNPDTKILGLRGLLEQNLKKQDYHHALIYAEEIYNINPRLDWIYKTIIQIIVRTKNWHKLIEISKNAFNKRIIHKTDYFKSISIAKYEIALIKESTSSIESSQLLKDANSDRPNFPPIVKKLANLLIQNNQLSKAKNLIFKCWSIEPHPMLFEELIEISKRENSSIVSATSKLIKNNATSYDSIIVLVKANIIENNWIRSKELIKPVLTARPNKTICELMYEIEIGITGNAQKANSWKNRAALGDIEKTWVCKNSGTIQEEWSSVSEGGFFDSLEWTWPKTYKLNQNNAAISEII